MDGRGQIRRGVGEESKRKREKGRKRERDKERERERDPRAISVNELVKGNF